MELTCARKLCLIGLSVCLSVCLAVCLSGDMCGNLYQMELTCYRKLCLVGLSVWLAVCLSVSPTRNKKFSFFFHFQFRKVDREPSVRCRLKLVTASRLMIRLSVVVEVLKEIQCVCCNAQCNAIKNFTVGTTILLCLVCLSVWLCLVGLSVCLSVSLSVYAKAAGKHDQN